MFLDKPNECVVQFKNDLSRASHMVAVSVRTNEAGTTIAFHPSTHSPYVVFNHSRYQMEVRQTTLRPQPVKIDAGSSVQFFWTNLFCLMYLSFAFRLSRVNIIVRLDPLTLQIRVCDPEFVRTRQTANATVRGSMQFGSGVDVDDLESGAVEEGHLLSSSSSASSLTKPRLDKVLWWVSIFSQTFLLFHSHRMRSI